MIKSQAMYVFSAAFLSVMSAGTKEVRSAKSVMGMKKYDKTN